MLQFLFTKTPLFYLTQSFWRDEAFSYFMAKKSLLDIIFLTAKDFSPPLYYFILHFWIKIFGGSEIAIRSLSIVFFWSTIYVVFLFLNEIIKLSQKKAFFYLILFIINPLLLYYAFEARMYSMFAFLASLSYYAFYKKNNKLYLISTIAGLFTHYFMLFVVFSQLGFLILNKVDVKYIKRKFVYLSLLIYSPWIFFFFSQNRVPSSFWLNKPHVRDIFAMLGIIYTGNEGMTFPTDLKFKIQNSLILISAILLIIISSGVYLYIKKLSNKDKLDSQMLFFWGIGIPTVIGLVSFIKPIYFPRYLIFTGVGFLLLNIFILEKINVYFRTILIVLLLLLTINYQKLQFEYRKKTNFRKVFSEIKLIAGKKDLIYVDDLDFFTALYYLEGNNVYVYGKSYKEIPAYNGKSLIPESKIASNLPFYPTKAFILKSNGQYSIQAMY